MNPFYFYHNHTFKLLIALLFMVTSCGGSNDNEKPSTDALDEASLYLFVKNKIRADLSEVVSVENNDCENDWSDLPQDSDFNFAKCFTVVQNSNNDFSRYIGPDDEIATADFNMVDWNPYWTEDDFGNLFQTITYWVLSNTIKEGDLNSDGVKDYAVKVLKQPVGYASALWVAEWYFLLSSDYTYNVTTTDLFESTYLKPSYDVTEIKGNIVVGAYQKYDTHRLPFNSKSILDTSNLINYNFNDQSFTFSKGHFYMIPYMTTPIEKHAVEQASEFKILHHTFTSYLWLQDFKSLSNKDLYVVYNGPFATEVMCRDRLREMKAAKLFKDSYGLLVSKQEERKEIRSE